MHKIIILPYSSTANPLGFPGEYPAEMRRIALDALIPNGWIEVTEADYQRRISTHFATVSSLQTAAEALQKADGETRHTQFITALRRLENLNDKLAAGTHTAAERLEAEVLNNRITLRLANWALEQLRNSNT